MSCQKGARFELDTLDRRLRQPVRGLSPRKLAWTAVLSGASPGLITSVPSPSAVAGSSCPNVDRKVLRAVRIFDCLHVTLDVVDVAAAHATIACQKQA